MSTPDTAPETSSPHDGAFFWDSTYLPEDIHEESFENDGELLPAVIDSEYLVLCDIVEDTSYVPIGTTSPPGQLEDTMVPSASETQTSSQAHVVDLDNPSGNPSADTVVHTPPTSDPATRTLPNLTFDTLPNEGPAFVVHTLTPSARTALQNVPSPFESDNVSSENVERLEESEQDGQSIALATSPEPILATSNSAAAPQTQSNTTADAENITPNSQSTIAEGVILITDEAQLATLTSKALVAQCKLRKIAIGGNKQVLCTRIKKHHAENPNYSVSTTFAFAEICIGSPDRESRCRPL
ncbi:hypothetical protein CYMTET_54628 [Cymbomonas tetramitiformis]|uniref:SAP domain-containing protein n=1 Tax=Cymbomonas tetramitiformis TaxID=36881 RepID=A0AAE0EP64_9CHLO|nr:hypothetical protein CYMTET_54628 [Cymbomonas tetramitiformis]